MTRASVSSGWATPARGFALGPSRRRTALAVALVAAAVLAAVAIVVFTIDRLSLGWAFAIAVPLALLLAWSAVALMNRLFSPLIERVERSERRFRTLARHSSDIVLLLDREARFVWLSTAVEGLFGYPPAALTGLEVIDFVHADDRPQVRRALAHALAAPEEPVRLDLRVRRADGGWHWLEAIGTNLLEVPEVGALVVNARDVTARREAELRVAQLNRLLRTSTEVGDAVVAASDEQALLEEVCRIGVDTGGYRLAWVGWRDAARIGRVRPAAFAGAAPGYLDDLEVRCDESPLGAGPTGRALRLGQAAVCRNLEQDPLMAPWRAQLLANGLRSSAALPIRIGDEVAGALSIYAGEVDAFDAERLALLGSLADTLGRGVQLLRLRADKERMAATLRASEESARQLFNRVPIGLYRTSPGGEFLDANPALVALLGFPSLEALWRTNAAEIYADPADRARWRAALERESEVADWLVRVRRPDGEIRLVHNSARTVRDESGRIVAFEGAAEDVTGHMEALDRLSATAADLQRTNEELQQLADVVARELQDPLRTVVSYIGLLERRLGDQLEEEPRQLLRHAAQGGERLRRLAQDLTTLARVGLHRGEPRAVELDRVLDEALSELAPAITETGARVERGPLPVVTGDPRQLVRLFVHLVGNALRFGGTDPPRVRVMAEKIGDSWQIAVEDNGIGVPPQDRERIFEVFQRLQRHPDYAGTGIGLAICRRIVFQHGGRIWVDAAASGGSVFRFTFPPHAPVPAVPAAPAGARH